MKPETKNKENEEDVLLQAAGLLLAGKTLEARALLSAISGQAEQSAEVNHLMGALCLHGGDAKGARVWFAQALALQPESALFHNDYAVALHQMGCVWQAEKEFSRALEIDSQLDSAKDNQLVLRQQLAGVAPLLEGNIEQLQQVIAAIPDHVEALLSLAELEAKVGRRHEALRHLNQLLGIQPDSLRALKLLDELQAIPERPFIVRERLLHPRPPCAHPSPLVSVTIVCFNQERYVRESVESVLAQTWSPLEIIIGDDGSSDATPDIIAECIATYSGPHHIEFVRNQANLGFSGHMNWLDVYRRTRGELVFQFCGDDVMHPDLIEKVTNFWQQTGVSLIAVNAELIDQDSKGLGRNRIPADKVPEASLLALARDGVNDCVFGAGLAIDRRLYEAFPQCSGNPPRHLRTLDIIYPFYAGLLNGCAVLSEPLMQYRIHGAQQSQSIALDYAKDELRKAVIEEKNWEGHLAHALYMREVLDAVVEIVPERYQELHSTLQPALLQQLQTMALRQVSARNRLYYEFGLLEVNTPTVI